MSAMDQHGSRSKSDTAMRGSTTEARSVAKADGSHPTQRLEVIRVAPPMAASDERKELVTQGL